MDRMMGYTSQLWRKKGGCIEAEYTHHMTWLLFSCSLSVFLRLIVIRYGVISTAFRVPKDYGFWKHPFFCLLVGNRGFSRRPVGVLIDFSSRSFLNLTLFTQEFLSWDFFYISFYFTNTTAHLWNNYVLHI